MTHTTAYKILAVDDEPDILTLVRFTLEGEGYAVATANSAEAAHREIARRGVPHLALVDIRMPKTDGIEFARQLTRSCDLPIVMLTAVNEESIVVQTLREVAEDYVVKPFRPQELLARVERVLRRVGSFAYASERRVEIDDELTIDFAGRTVRRSGQVVSLTPTENKILHLLVRDAGRTVTTDFFLRRVWPLEEVFEDSLRVHIHRLRHKIERVPSQPKYIRTHREAGYSFLRPAWKPGTGSAPRRALPASPSP